MVNSLTSASWDLWGSIYFRLSAYVYLSKLGVFYFRIYFLNTGNVSWCDAHPVARGSDRLPLHIRAAWGRAMRCADHSGCRLLYVTYQVKYKSVDYSIRLEHNFILRSLSIAKSYTLFIHEPKGFFPLLANKREIVGRKLHAASSLSCAWNGMSYMVDSVLNLSRIQWTHWPLCTAFPYRV